MRKRIVIWTLLAILAAAGLYAWHLATPQTRYMLDRHGLLVDRLVSAASADGVIDELLHLESSSGLKVDARVKRPVSETRLPVLLVLGGHDTGKDAVDLVGSPAGVAFVAIDYPFYANHHPDGVWESLAIVDDVQQAFLDTPPALSLIVDWLLEQPWVDPRRIELIGVSLGVPFAAAAGALDTRFDRVWLMHGGGDNASWTAHGARRHIGNDTLRRIVSQAALLLAYGNSFDTVHWIEQTAPRPVVLVMARNDDYVPPEAQQPLIEVARSEHVELIWTEGLHIGPERSFELQQLLQTVLERTDY
jgi:cephalosporin-C deacetylase-like acetyl esterase